MKKIIASYSVCDCEHQGDISRACHEVRQAGGEVITTEWDGHDCGEAYVYCLIDEDVYRTLKHDYEYEWQNAEHMRSYFTKKGYIK